MPERYKSFMQKDTEALSQKDTDKVLVFETQSTLRPIAVAEFFILRSISMFWSISTNSSNTE